MRIEKNPENYKPMVDISLVARALGKGIKSTKELIRRFNVDFIYYKDGIKLNEDTAWAFIDGYKNKKL